MIYVGFSERTNKFWARVICKKYRHCAPVLIKNDKCMLFQFAAYKKISIINIRKADIDKLKHFGWVFIKCDNRCDIQTALKSKPLTCVQFTKRALHIKKVNIQTPDALLKYLKTK